jgi:hypothetical protein
MVVRLIWIWLRLERLVRRHYLAVTMIEHSGDYAAMRMRRIRTEAANGSTKPGVHSK